MINEFELQGRVGYIECKFVDNDRGTVYTNINLGVKKNEKLNDDEEKNWDNFFITFFNTEKRPTAEILSERVHKGDYIRVAGKLAENRYIPKDAEQIKENERSEIQLIGFGFKKMKFDDFKNKWVDMD